MGGHTRLAVALAILVFVGPLAAADALLVSTAISLEPALREVADRFRIDGPVVLNAGGSGVLMQQIRRGAPVDLFVSASPNELDRLADEGLLADGGRRWIASNALVVVVPRGVEPPPHLDGVGDPRFDRVATGNPRTAPVGRYAHELLERAGLSARVGPRLVFAENARQVLDWVDRGEAIGIVYRTDAERLRERVTIGPPVPARLQPSIRYEAAVVTTADHPGAAVRFLDRLSSAEGRAILARHGFTVER